MTIEQDLIDRLYADLPGEFEGEKRTEAYVVRSLRDHVIGSRVDYKAKAVVAWYGCDKAAVAMPQGTRILHAYFVDNAASLFDQWLNDQRWFQAELIRQDTTIAVGVPCEGLRAHDIIEIDDSLGSWAGTCDKCSQVILVQSIWDFGNWRPVAHTVTQQLPVLREEKA